MNRWLWAILILLTWTSLAWSANRYASPSGSGSSCTDQSPCSLSSALSAANAGDTVILKNGVYTGYWDSVRSGTSGSRITITGETKCGATIRANAGNPTGDATHLFDIKHSYITLRYLKFDGLGNHREQSAIRSQSSGSQLQGNIIEHNCIQNMGIHGMELRNSNNLTVRFNTIAGTGMYSDEADPGEALYFSWPTGGLPATNVEVYGNTLTNVNGECFDLKQDTDEIQIHHNICEAQQDDSSSDPRVITGLLSSQGASNIDFYDNILRNYDTTPPSGTGVFTIYTTSANVMIEDNVVHGGTHGNVTQGNSGPLTNITIRNNTFCNLNNYSTHSVIDSQGVTFTTNNGYHPGSGVSQATCDTEVTRILSEMAALPGSEMTSDLFVDDTGSGSTCSSASPCLLATALGQVTAGGTIWFNDGTYGRFDTPANNVSFRALNKHLAIIYHSQSSSPVHAINCTHSGIVIDGLRANGNKVGGVNHGVVRGSTGCNNLTLRNMYVENSAGELINWGGTINTNLQGLLIEDSIIEAAGYNNDTGEGIYLGQFQGNNTVSDIIIRRNYIKDFGDNAIDCKPGCNNIEIYHNVIELQKTNNGAVSTTDGSIVVQGSAVNIHDNIIRQNNLTGEGGSSVIRIPFNGTTFANNVLWGNTHNGPLIRDRSGGAGNQSEISFNLFCSNSNSTIASGFNVHDNQVLVGTPSPGCSDRQTEILNLIAGTTPPPGENPTSGLIAWWTFDSTLNDVYGNHLSYSAGGSPSYVAGQIGNAISLNGTNFVTPFVQVIGTTRLFPGPGNPFSVSAWFKTSATGTVIAQAVDVAGDRDFQIAVTSAGDVDLYLRGGLTSTAALTYANNAWHHMVVTWDGSVAKWYVDNAVESASAVVGTSPVDTLEPIFIGARTGGGGFRFTGSLDDIRIYNRAITAAEVSSLYGFAVDTTDPTAPTNVNAVAVTDTRIDLSWTLGTDNSGVILATHIERCQGGGCTSFVEHDTSAGTAYSDLALSPNTTYRYRLYSEDPSLNTSGYSSIVEATTPNTPAVGVSTQMKLGVYWGGRMR